MYSVRKQAHAYAGQLTNLGSTVALVNEKSLAEMRAWEPNYMACVVKKKLASFPGEAIIHGKSRVLIKL